jgi:hypothetical protein
MEFTYHLMSWLIGSLMAVAGASKLADARAASPDEELRWPWSAMLRISTTKQFALVEFWGGTFFWILSPGLIRSLAAGGVAAMVVAGIALRRQRKNASCRCFGALTPQNPRWLLLLEAGLFVLAAAVAVSGLHFRFALPQVALQLLGSLATVALAVAVTLKAAPAAVPVNKPAPPRPAATPLPVLDADTVLGRKQSGDVVALGTLAKPDSPVFVVGVHSKCKTCKRLLPDLLGFARGFGDQFPIVLVANEADYVPDDGAAAQLVLVDEEESLARQFNLDGRPFAVLINGSTLQPMAPPSMGDNAVRMLFAVMLNARLPAVA